MRYHHLNYEIQIIKATRQIKIISLKLARIKSYIEEERYTTSSKIKKSEYTLFDTKSKHKVFRRIICISFFFSYTFFLGGLELGWGIANTSVVKSAGRTEAMREKLWGAGREATGRAPHGSGAP